MRERRDSALLAVLKDSMGVRPSNCPSCSSCCKQHFVGLANVSLRGDFDMSYKMQHMCEVDVTMKRIA